MGGALYRSIPHLPCPSSYRNEHLSRIPLDEGAECTCWTQEPRLTTFQVAVMADLAAPCQVSAPEPENGTRFTCLSLLP